VGVFVLYSVVALLLINKVDSLEMNRNYTENELLESSSVKNILLIGTDGRTSNEQARSDSMVLVSINSKSKQVVVTSFMRDMYVYIPEYHYDKLNASYSYGGASLLLDTLEENFSIRIDDCMVVDFTSFVEMVDALGGIDMEVSDEEAEAINNILISEVNEIMGDDRMSDLLSGGGTLRLDGKQALSYSRIRYVGNADFERTQRQRDVITAMVDRLKTPNVFRIGTFANTTASEISSNMSTLDMYQLSLQVPFILGYEIVQQRIPADDTWYYDDIDGQSVIVADFEQNVDYLKETIYNYE
jgi:LCP family protein required for cell wall assembly